MRQFGVVIFVLLVMTGGMLYADETPTAEPATVEPATATLEPTSTPSPTLTLEPSLTWTSLPTATEMPGSTATYVETLTATLEAGFTETATEASISETPALTSTLSTTATIQLSSTATASSTHDPRLPLPPTPSVGDMSPMNQPLQQNGMFQPNLVPTIEYINADDITELGAAIIAAKNNPQNTYVISLTASNYEITQSLSDPYDPPNSWADLRNSNSQVPNIYIIGNPLEKTKIKFMGSTSTNLRWITNHGFLVLKHLSIEGFTNTHAGAAIYNYGQLYLYDVALTGNKSGYHGGAITNVGSLDAWNVTFKENEAQGYGGAISNEEQGRIALTCATFEGNKTFGYVFEFDGSKGGAALRQFGQSPSGTVTITKSNFLQPLPFAIWQPSGSVGVNAGGNFWNGPAIDQVAGSNIAIANPASTPFSLSCPEPEIVKVPTLGCSSGFVRLATANPAPLFRPQYKDMKGVIALDSSQQYSIGLYLHDGPTWNSNPMWDGEADPAESLPRLDWGTVVPIDGRIEFRDQLGQEATFIEVWYRHRSKRAPYIDVWFLAYTKAQNQTYIYVQGFDEQGNDPCANQPQEVITDLTDTGQSITFSYDRVATAKYAMAHAYRNSESDPSYIEKDGLLDVEVTDRIEDQTLAEGTIPYAGTIPYFDFKFSLDYAGSITGSAYFTSQSIWFGGIPMTKDKDATEQRCGGYPTTATELGWRHCRDKGSTGVFANHDGIVAFLSDADSTAAANVSSYRFNIDIIYPRGVYANLISLTEPNGKLTKQIGDLLGEIQTGVEKDILVERLYNEMKIVLIKDTVKAGDYVWTSRSHPERHGYLVVGWGPIVKCSVALSKLWSLDSDPVTSDRLYVTSATADTIYQWSVPYVSDFSIPYDFGGRQRPRPRPFYCSQYLDRDGYQDSFDGFRFNTFPEYVELPANMIYISEKME